MFKMTFQQIQNEALVTGLRKLGNVSGLPQSVGYDIIKVIRLIEPELKNFHETMQKIQTENRETHAVLIQIGDEAQKKLAFDEFEKKARVAITELLDFEVTIGWHKISRMVLDKAGLTPFELEAVEPLLTDDLQAVGAPSNVVKLS